MKRAILILFVLVLALAAGSALGWLGRDSAIGLPPMPDSYLQVTKVKEIPVPEYVEVLVPGEKPKAVVVERVVFRTEPAPPPVQDLLIQTVCEPGDLLGRIEVDAAKFVGQEGGVITEGWNGTMLCQVQNTRVGPAWVDVARQPISLSLSRAVSVLPPMRPDLPRLLETRVGIGAPSHVSLGASWYDEGKRWGWGMDVSRDFEPDTILSSDQYRDAARYRGTIYLTRRWGRR